MTKGTDEAPNAVWPTPTSVNSSLMMPTPFPMPKPPVVDSPVEPVSVEFISPEPPAVVSSAAAAIKGAVKNAAKTPIQVKVRDGYKGCV